MPQKRFDITGRKAASEAPIATESTMDRFIAGTEPQTTITVQIPVRLKRALKREALEYDTTMKNLLIHILEMHFAESKQ